MWSVDDLNEADETLSAQLRLALASPLWKELPYGLQVNPRAWRIDLLDVRPCHRLCARIVIPWRSASAGLSPFQFIVVIWHKRQAFCVHHRLLGLNARLAERAKNRAPRLMFYDGISRAFVGQVRTSAPASAPLNPRWMKRLPRAIFRFLRK